MTVEIEIMREEVAAQNSLNDFLSQVRDEFLVPEKDYFTITDIANAVDGKVLNKSTGSTAHSARAISFFMRAQDRRVVSGEMDKGNKSNRLIIYSELGAQALCELLWADEFYGRFPKGIDWKGNVEKLKKMVGNEEISQMLLLPDPKRRFPERVKNE